MQPNKTYYHQCGIWTIGPGRKQDCYTCSRRKSNPNGAVERPKPRYTFEEAAYAVDVCAECSDRIEETHEHHHCEKCLPAWLERMAEINAQQERGEGEWNVDQN